MEYRVIKLDEKTGWSRDVYGSEDDLRTAMTAAGCKYQGPNNNPAHRAELQGQPKFRGLLGPMWDGDAVRYECSAAYKVLSR